MVGLLVLIPTFILMVGVFFFIKFIKKKEFKKSLLVTLITVSTLFLYHTYNNSYGYKGVAPKTPIIKEEKHFELYIEKSPVPEVKSLTKRTSPESIEERRLERIEKAKIKQSE